MGAKKAANLFRIYCFMCRCGTAGYSVFIVVQCGKLEVVISMLFLSPEQIVLVAFSDRFLQKVS